MPHYKNGTPAKIGDLVLSTPRHPGTISTLGIITAIQPNCQACDGQLAPLARKLENGQWFPVSPLYDNTVTLQECLPMTTEATAESEQSTGELVAAGAGG